MSKHAADLCTILVDEFYGSLASQIYHTLITHGRCSLGALPHYIKLPISQIRQALAVLIQAGLLYWYTVGSATFYEPNISAAYNLVRVGKYVQLVEDRLGKSAAGVIKELSLSGYSRIRDLQATFRSTAPSDSNNNFGDSASTNGASKKTFHGNGGVPQPGSSDSVSHGQSMIDLFNANFIHLAQDAFFRTETDNRTEAGYGIKDVHQSKMSKRDQEAMRNEHIKEQVDEWMYNSNKPSGEGSTLTRKRPVENGDQQASNKRPRLQEGSEVRVNGCTPTQHDEQVWKVSDLKPDLIVCINYSKFTILLRNERLVALVERRLCSATAYVYGRVLEALQPRLLDCQYNEGRGVHDNDLDSLHVTTGAIAAAIPDTEILRDTLGQIEGEDTEVDILEHPKKRRRKHAGGADMRNGSFAESEPESDEQSSIASDDSFDAMELSEAEFGHTRSQTLSATPHELAVRSHLRLLSLHPLSFITRVKHPFSRTESWTVNFPSLVKTMQGLEVEHTMSSRYGSKASRSARILQDYGKLDDRALASLALIREKEIRGYLTTMQRDGVLELQEVPRDNSRTAARTTFLFFFDHERCVRRLLEDAYKTMTRLLQRLNVEKEKVQATLEKASRSDVVGNEEQLLSPAEQDALKQWRGVEEKLWGQVAEIDDTVALLRDF